MADPTSALNFGSRPFSLVDGRHTFVIKNAEPLVLNAFVMVDKTTGLVEFAESSSNNLIPVGLVNSAFNGINNSTYLTGNAGGTNKVNVQGKIKIQYPVTGATAITDIGKGVYATDGQTLTLTVPAAGLPVGIVTNWISGTTCEIHLFDFEEGMNVQKNGLAQYYRYMPIGTFLTNAMQGTSAMTLVTLPAAYEKYKIVSLHAQCAGYDNAAVAGSQVVNAYIGSTITTGGNLTLAYTNCDASGDMGTAINATAITAANTVAVGDVVSLKVASSGTGFTADAVSAFFIYMIIQVLP